MRRITSRHLAAVIGVGFLLGLALYKTRAVCAQDTNTASVADLQQRVQELETVVQQMKDSRNANSATVAPVSMPSGGPSGSAASSAAPTANANSVVSDAPGGGTGDPAGGNFVGWNEGFFLQSPDRSCQLRITGQIQADCRTYLDHVDASTTANSAVAGSPTTGSPDEFLIRRARLGIEATMANYYEFRLLPDFAGTTVAKSITDAYLNIHYWDQFQLEAGKFKQPLSYEELIQDRYVPFMERSMMDQLTPQRDEGVMIHGDKLFCGRFDYAVAVSNGDSNDSTFDNNDHKDFNGRLVFRPFFDRDGQGVFRLLSFGISGGVGVENEPLSTSSSTPPTITTPSTVTWFAFNPTTTPVTGGTAAVAANGLRDRISPEVSYFYSSLGFAAQYYQQDQLFQTSSSKAALVDVSYNGYYAMVSYLLTGEQRHEYSQQIEPYLPFDPSAPVASPGAWEVLLRVDRMEVGQSAFTSGLASAKSTTNQSSPACFETTTGINWYMNKWVRATELGTCQLCQLHKDRQHDQDAQRRGRVVHAVPGHLLRTCSERCWSPGFSRLKPGRQHRSPAFRNRLQEMRKPAFPASG